MKGQAGLGDVDERYARLSAAGDPLERLNTVIAWEMFRRPLTKALNRPDRAQGGRPPYDAVMMFKILVLQALYGLSARYTTHVVSVSGNGILGALAAHAFWAARG